MWKTLAKYGIKALGWLLKAGKAGAITLGKGAVAAVKFLQAHPNLFFNLISMAVGATVNDVVNSYAAQKGIKTAEVSKYLEYINELEKDLNGLGDLDGIIQNFSGPDSNHYPWWFADQVLAAYFKPEDFAQRNDKLRECVVHTMGHYAPFEVTDITADSIYRAYLEYYKRLNIGVTTTTVTSDGNESRAVAQVVVPPHNKAEVIRDIKNIIERSWIGVTNLLELQRMESAYEINSNGSYNLPFGLLGFVDCNVPQGNGWNSSLGYSSPMFPSMLYPVDTSNIQDFFGYKAFQTPAPCAYAALNDLWDTSDLRKAHGPRYNYGNISNADWKSLVARAHRDLHISENAWQFARYLYEGVFIDQPKEDNMECYVFVSELFDANHWYEQEAGTLLSSLKACCTAIEATIESDRAYENLLLHLNVSPYGDKKSEFYRWEFRRDLSHTTLIIKSTDDKFYTAIQNAAVMLRMPAKEYLIKGNEGSNPFSTALSTCRELELYSPNSVTSWAKGGPQRGIIYMGPRDEINDISNMYKLLPDLTTAKAGEVASAMKFGGQARLRYYSRLTFDNVPAGYSNKWIVTYFNMTNSTIWADNVKGELKYDYLGKWNDLARKEWAFAQEMERLKGSFSVNNGYKVFCVGIRDGAEDDPQVDYLQRFANPGFRRIDVTNLDTVLLYQYTNLYMGVGSNEELLNQLEVLKDWYKTSM